MSRRLVAAGAVCVLAAAGFLAGARGHRADSATTTYSSAQIQQLLDDAVALLKQTTVGYAGHSSAWQNNQTTKWWQALNKIAQARAALDPPVTTSATTTAPVTTTGSGGGVTAANIWVDTNGGSCSRNATQTSYSDGLACGSLDAANDVCRGGDIVAVKGGTYPAVQNVSGTNGRSSACLVVNARGEVVTLGPGSDQAVDFLSTSGYLTLDGSYGAPCLAASCMGFRAASFVNNGFTAQARWGTDRGASHLTLEHLDIGNVSDGANATVIAYNDLGPSVDPYNNRQNSDGTVWKDNLIHDQKVVNGGHYECLTFDGGQNVTVRRNLFRSCDIYGLFEKPVTALVSGTISGNSWADPAGYGTVDLDITDDGSPGNITCNMAVTGNWFTNGFQNSCPGITASGNTNTSSPPDPRLDPDP